MGNAAAAYAVLREFGVSADAMQAMESVTPEAAFDATAGGKAVVWNDAYNANPESIRSAMAAFADLVEQIDWVLVLGEVLELGEWSEQAHQELGVNIIQSHAADPFQEILLVGDAFRPSPPSSRHDGLPVGMPARRCPSRAVPLDAGVSGGGLDEGFAGDRSRTTSSFGWRGTPLGVDGVISKMLFLLSLKSIDATDWWFYGLIRLMQNTEFRMALAVLVCLRVLAAPSVLHGCGPKRSGIWPNPTTVTSMP